MASLTARPPQISQNGARNSSEYPNQCGHWIKITHTYTKCVFQNMWTLVHTLTCDLIARRGARTACGGDHCHPPSAIDQSRPNKYRLPTNVVFPDWYTHELSKTIWYDDFSAKLAKILRLISAVRN